MLQRADVPLRPFQSESSQDRAELEVSATERRLARQLDTLLSEKGEQNTAPKLAKKEPPSEVRSVQDLEDFEAATDDFEWAAIVSDHHDGVPLATDTAEAWLQKARRDQRRQKLRNFAGWMVTMAVGAVFVGGAAWLLAGWTPDIDRLVGLFSGVLS